MTTRKKKTGKRTRNSDAVGKEIHRQWGDLDVVDAREDLRVFIMPEDVALATPQDPGCCVFAQACMRAFKASKVLFYRSLAYVELPQENGTRRVERFMLSSAMRKLIEEFDRGHPVIPEAGFLLKAVRPSQRFEAKKKYNKGQKLRRELQGTSDYEPARSRQFSQPVVVDTVVRNGIGAVHFTFRKKTAPAGK